MLYSNNTSKMLFWWDDNSVAAPVIETESKEWDESIDKIIYLMLAGIFLNLFSSTTNGFVFVCPYVLPSRILQTQRIMGNVYMGSILKL